MQFGHGSLPLTAVGNDHERFVIFYDARLFCGIYMDDLFHPCSNPDKMKMLLRFLFCIGGSRSSGFPGGASSTEPTCQCRRNKRCMFDPWVRKIPRGEHGNPFQYSCLENPMDRGAWWATVHRVVKSQT